RFGGENVAEEPRCFQIPVISVRTGRHRHGVGHHRIRVALKRKWSCECSWITATELEILNVLRTEFRQIRLPCEWWCDLVVIVQAEYLQQRALRRVQGVIPSIVWARIEITPNSSLNVIPDQLISPRASGGQG